MVKFSKQFGAQLVPEWKDAFVDYWQLKKDLKKLQVLSPNQNSATKSSHETLSQRLLTPIKKLSFFGDGHRRKHEVIQIHRKLASSASKGDLYETELLDQFADTDSARDFFARLDLQLNKVNQFYKGKEMEFVERGESLRKQMDILVVLRTEMERRRDAKEDQSISGSISCEIGRTVKSRGGAMEAEESVRGDGEPGGGGGREDDARAIVRVVHALSSVPSRCEKHGLCEAFQFCCQLEDPGIIRNVGLLKRYICRFERNKKQRYIFCI